MRGMEKREPAIYRVAHDCVSIHAPRVGGDVGFSVQLSCCALCSAPHNAHYVEREIMRSFFVNIA